MKDNFCYFNGETVKFSEIKISPFDLGFVRGYGIFDALRTTANGAPFCLREHWEKLEKSARELCLNLPISQNDFEKIILELLKINNLKEAAVKTILTGGQSSNGFKSAEGFTFLIIASDLQDFSLQDLVYQEGVKIISHEHQRFLPEIKHLNYLIPLSLRKIKEEKSAFEILYKKDGKILECSTSNIFLVKDNCLITAQEKVFKGTTRNLTLELARKNGLKTEERAIDFSEIETADEIFLTATYKKIVPVVQIDEIKIGNGQAEKTTKTVMDLLDEFLANYDGK